MITMTLISAVLTALVARGLLSLVSTRTKFHRDQSLTSPMVTAFTCQLIIGGITMYFFMPALVGTFFGLTPILITSAISLALTAAIFWFVDDSENYRPNRGIRIAMIPAGLVVLMLVVWGITFAVVTWSPGNAKVNASFANVKTASTDERLPKTDPNHMVLVTQSMAAYLGQQALASGGNNLGSIYKTEETSYTLQAVAGHLYWIAPLIYVSDWNRAGFGLDDIGVRGGFVAVDAEDPNAAVRIKQEHDLAFQPDMYFGRDLLRHVYSSGYMFGSLEDPTIEVDDNWKPYFTIAWTHPVRTVRGNKITKVLLVDPSNGNIQEFDPEKVPTWVDRVMYKDLIAEYLDQWGLWGDPKALNDWPQLFSTKFQTKPVEFELLYNAADRPVFLVPITSRNNTDLSCTGIMLYNSNRNEATYYPGLAGIGIGDNVRDAFEHNPKNLKGYKIAHLQLYSINGEPTWVGIYVQPAGAHGTTFAAIGMLDARHVQGANVVMAPDKRSALSAYSSYLASAGSGNGIRVAQGGQPSKVVTGTIYRIGFTVVDNQTLYTIKLTDDPHVFTATLKVRGDLPLVREGDTVRLTYLDTSETTESVIELSVKELDNKALPKPTPVEKAPEPTTK